MTLYPSLPPIAIDAFGALTIGIVVYFIGARLTQKFRILPLGLFHPRTEQRRPLRRPPSPLYRALNQMRCHL